MPWHYRGCLLTTPIFSQLIAGNHAGLCHLE
jgi:hypothetical protein